MANLRVIAFVVQPKYHWHVKRYIAADLLWYRETGAFWGDNNKIAPSSNKCYKAWRETAQFLSIESGLRFSADEIGDYLSELAKGRV